MEVVLNWSLINSNGYSAAKRQSIAAHELGHAFGLAHNPSNKAVLMYPYDTRTVLVPQSDDKAGVNAIY
jgi:predicted Zn-dependent protease